MRMLEPPPIDYLRARLRVPAMAACILLHLGNAGVLLSTLPCFRKLWNKLYCIVYCISDIRAAWERRARPRRRAAAGRIAVIR